MPQPLATELATSVNAYLEYLQVVRRTPASSLAGRRQDLQRFLEFARERGLERVEQIDVHSVRAYVARRSRLGLAPVSVRRELSSLRSFLQAQCRNGLLLANPAAEVRSPKVARRLPSAFEAEPLNVALDQEPDGALEARDRAMAELLYSCGLRLGELQPLQLGQFDAGLSELRVTGKGGKTRVLPVGAQARAALAAWLALRPGGQGAGAALFPGRDGEPLSRSAIAGRLKLWARRAGLAGRVHPHRFRHAFASHLLEGSGDLRAVQELLGHANLATTQIYTHLDFDRLARVYDQAHPRARSKSGPK
ncbi:tyrosine recombinase XerC [Stagnimonas aquatica]|uniref:Tyrosine recombinase XerC n=1 Tax=Stagnimonas aquatica TaxID=2689987 RepID=A0A3N0VLY7_9GAMM|nr:tyrosine recombinase XerC [Stagnimonas aquatica]ROH93038.1 tyrosine recombinase XerC [Stagnimonas aquatica]